MRRLMATVVAAIAVSMLAGCGTTTNGAGRTPSASGPGTASVSTPATTEQPSTTPEPSVNTSGGEERFAQPAQVFPEFSGCASTETAALLGPLDPPRGTVPEGFEAVRGILCQRAIADGEWSVTETTEVAPLVDLAAQPSDPRTTEACVAMAEIYPVVWLVAGDGTAVTIALPVDACDFTKPVVSTTIDEVF